MALRQMQRDLKVQHIGLQIQARIAPGELFAAGSWPRSRSWWRCRGFWLVPGGRNLGSLFRRMSLARAMSWCDSVA